MPRVQKFRLRKKKLDWGILRWFCSNLQLCSTKRKIFQSQRFHQRNQINKAPTIDRCVKHQASGHHDLEETNWQNGQLTDSLHASCKGLKGPHYLDLFHTLTYLTYMTKLTQPSHELPNRPRAWPMKTTLTSQDENYFAKFSLGVSGLFSPLRGFCVAWFRVFVAGVFFIWQNMLLENCCPSRVVHKTGPVRINIKCY